MGLGMVLVGIATNIPVYLIGACVIGFFIPHDMQATYLLSTPHVTTVQQPVYRIGEMLAEQLLKERGVTNIRINSREKALGFYEKLGYTPDFSTRSGEGEFVCIMTSKTL